MDSVRLPPEAAAAYIGDSKTPTAATLANWRTKGTGPRFIKVGRLVFYDRAELDRWMAERTAASTADAARLVKSSSEAR